MACGTRIRTAGCAFFSYSTVREIHSSIFKQIFFDILRPPPPASLTARPYRIHCQAFLRLSTSGNAPKTGLGRFDLDSSKDKPVPSGSFGRVELVSRDKPESDSPHGFFHRRRTSSNSSAGHKRETSVDLADGGTGGEVVEVRYFLTKDVLEVQNEVDDSTKGGNIWLPTKNLSVSSWVSCDSTRVDLIIKLVFCSGL